MDSDNNIEQKQTKKELFASFDKLRNEINSLRRELNTIDREKESWLEKKKELFDEIEEKISSVKENRVKRDGLTKKVKELKGERSKLSQKTKENISEFKNLSDEKKSLMKKYRINNPNELKREIDKIEVKLETEAMPFENEKKLSKQLKALKKSLSEASVILDASNKIKKLNQEINSYKKDTDKTHNEVQALATKSQELHLSIITRLKGIDESRIKEKEAFKNFSKLKKSFNDINYKLKEKLGEMGKIRKKINKFKLEEEEKIKLRESMAIKSKEHEIEEKIKKGKKITTEDFLAFQDIVKDKKF
ncbi:MAG: hypothetical protein QF917_00945 [Candidatus Woesearchaeota archaeon]|jgi:uncharacterized coiled-coil DUF342 family protein|nr:hypothetical protein [Candidatus Woesearchaeota archaeon]|tara:strand:- start:5541 stop:6455 length:915 start_codon:yes stop_codon:yes gene_type:complete